MGECPTRRPTFDDRCLQTICSYASEHACTHVFCFDGRHLILTRFEASQVNDFEACRVKCWLIPVNSTDCSVRMAFYHFIRQALHCVQARSAKVLRSGPWESKYFWHTGQVYWRHVSTNQEVLLPPDWSKRWNADVCCWEWADASGMIVGS